MVTVQVGLIAFSGRQTSGNGGEGHSRQRPYKTAVNKTILRWCWRPAEAALSCAKSVTRRVVVCKLLSSPQSAACEVLSQTVMHWYDKFTPFCELGFDFRKEVTQPCICELLILAQSVRLCECFVRCFSSCAYRCKVHFTS